MKTICKHAYPSDLCGICNPLAKKKADSPSDATTCSAWVRTADKLPGQVGDQVDVLMWSPEWATWLKGMVTRWEDECEWAIYNQQDDRYHEWPYPPEFWMSPILPNARAMPPAKDQANEK